MIFGNLSGAKNAIETLKLLALSPQDLSRHFGKMGRQVVKLARLRIQSEEDLDGKAWAPRKRRKLKGSQNLLNKIASAKVLGVWQDCDQVTVTYFNSVSGKIAYKHQYGVTTTFTMKDKSDMDLSENGKKEEAAEKKKKKEKLISTALGIIFLMGRKKEGTESKIQNSCTEKQAEELAKLGFRQRMKGGVWQKRSAKWITEHVTATQADVIIDKMSRSKPDNNHKSSWPIPLPPRPFLGLNKKEREEMGLQILKDMKDELTKNSK